MRTFAMLLLLCGLCGCGTPDIVDPIPHFFQVSGDVAKPGAYVLMRGMRLRQGIASAGGYTGSISEIAIIRNGKPAFQTDGHTLEAMPENKDPKLKNGDSIVLNK
jgi:protein involved in polysaccharide export with SLBB domain